MAKKAIPNPSKGREWLPEEDLDPDDPRNRFIADCNPGEGFESSPLTEEQKLEAERVWEEFTGGKYSPGRKKRESR